MNKAQYAIFKQKQAEKYKWATEEEKAIHRKIAAARIAAANCGLTINKLSKQDKYFVTNTKTNFTKFFDNLDAASDWIKNFGEVQKFLNNGGVTPSSDYLKNLYDRAQKHGIRFYSDKFTSSVNFWVVDTKGDLPTQIMTADQIDELLTQLDAADAAQD